MNFLRRYVPLKRHVGLRTKPKADPVTPDVWEEVVQRDIRIAGGCVAPYLDAQAGWCRDRWGMPVVPWTRAALTVDHVREFEGGERRSVPRWLVTGCWGHHVHSGWFTAHRGLLRKYLAEHAR